MANISDETREIWRAAKEAQDIRTGKIRKGTTKKTSYENTAYINPKTRDRYVKVGRVLYYKHRKTGENCQGSVIKITGKNFTFRFGTRTRSLPLEIVGHRLFYTEGEARKYGKMDSQSKE